MLASSMTTKTRVYRVLGYKMSHHTVSVTRLSDPSIYSTSRVHICFIYFVINDKGICIYIYIQYIVYVC